MHYPRGRTRIDLRPYQIEAAAAAERALATSNSTLIHLPTGTGKTVLGLDLCARRNRALWVAHMSQLIDQPRRTWGVLGPSGSQSARLRGGASAHVGEHAAQLLVASPQTLLRTGTGEAALAQLAGVELAVLDEAHHYAASTWSRLIEWLNARAIPIVGLTATLERADGESLEDSFGSVCYTLQLCEAMDRGYLAPLEAIHRWRVTALEHDEAERDMIARGRASAAERHLEERLARAVETVSEETVDAYLAHGKADGRLRPAIAITVLVAQAERTAELAIARGVRATHVAGDMPQGERKRRIEAYLAGEYDLIASAGVLTEGFDGPLTEVVILARPCSSKALYLQAIGRGSRLSPKTGKTGWCVIDLGGGSEVHSLHQAPILCGESKGEPGEPQDRDGGGGAGEISFVGGGSPAPPVRWVRYAPGKLTASPTAGVDVMVCGVERDRVEVSIARRGTRTREVLGVWPWDYAEGVGQDACRRLAPKSRNYAQLDGAGQWVRHRAASDKQLALLRRLGVVDPLLPQGIRHGEASDLISAALARQRQRLPRLTLGPLREVIAGWSGWRP